MNALQQRVDTQPALPQGFPARWPITPTGQIAAQLSHRLPEGACRHPIGRLTGLGGHNGKQICLEHLVRRALRLMTGQIPQAQQTNCQGDNNPCLRIRRSAV